MSKGWYQVQGRVAGEGEIIEEFLAPLASGFAGAQGLKDDCAVLAPPAGEDLVLTTDAVAAGVHFLADDDPRDIAWKALAVNVSDLAGKGARPIAYLMALSFPEPPERQWLAAFAEGLATAQQAFSITLAGGDTDRRPGPQTVTITAIGSVPKGRAVLRTTARPGDRILLSGTLGDSALGLMLRMAPRLAAHWGLDASGGASLLDRYLRPSPRLALREALLSHASAAMDISDGLIKDLGRLAAASGVRARVVSRDVPLSPAASRAFATNPALLREILAGGDDYEVLATVAPARAPLFQAVAAASGVPVKEIGEIGEGSGVTVEGAAGEPIAFDRPGWDHF